MSLRRCGAIESGDCTCAQASLQLVFAVDSLASWASLPCGARTAAQAACRLRVLTPPRYAQQRQRLCRCRGAGPCRRSHGRWCLSRTTQLRRTDNSTVRYLEQPSGLASSDMTSSVPAPHQARSITMQAGADSMVPARNKCGAAMSSRMAGSRAHMRAAGSACPSARACHHSRRH